MGKYIGISESAAALAVLPAHTPNYFLGPPAVFETSFNDGIGTLTYYAFKQSAARTYMHTPPKHIFRRPYLLLILLSRTSQEQHIVNHTLHI